MYLDKEFENSILFYCTLILILVISSFYGMFSLFTGASEKGAFILTIAALFYVALYYRLFCEDDQDV